MAETTGWSADNAESWGDWKADIADGNAQSAESYYETAERAIASGDTEFAQQMIDDGDMYAQNAADGYESAADQYETAASWTPRRPGTPPTPPTSATDAAEAYGTRRRRVRHGRRRLRHPADASASAYDASAYDASATAYDASATAYDASASAYDASAAGRHSVGRHVVVRRGHRRLDAPWAAASSSTPSAPCGRRPAGSAPT